MSTLVVNGRDVEVAAATTVAELVRSLGKDPTVAGLAVARNGEVVPRRSWDAVRLDDGDRVEVLDAVSGG